MEAKESVRVIALRVRDFKRIEAFEAAFSPGLTLLAGPNAAGKSSVLDAVVAALGGRRAVPPRPIRDGAATADVVVDLGPYLVHRHWRGDGETFLSIVRKDGQAITRPQEFLDGLCGRGEVFDPLAPLRERPERFAEILRDLAGLDFRDLDARRDHLYAARREVGRSRKIAEGAATMSPRHPDAPSDPIDLGPLRAEQQEAFRAYGRRERLAVMLEGVDVEDVRERENLTDLERKVAQSRQRLEQLARERAEVQEKLAAVPEPDLDGIAARIREVEEVNRKVFENREREGRLFLASRQQQRYDELTREIETIDAEKEERIAAARYPVPGLTVEDDRVLLDGRPVEQASSGQRIELGLALAAALRPGLRTLLVREGSLLDADALERVRSWAVSRDVSVLLEVVESEPGSIPGAIEIREGRGSVSYFAGRPARKDDDDHFFGEVPPSC